MRSRGGSEAGVEAMLATGYAEAYCPGLAAKPLTAKFDVAWLHLFAK
jgi:hypothetical protein